MKIEMTDEVKKRLLPFVEKGKVLLLDLDNGLGPYSAEGNWALVTSFRFIAIDADAPKSDYGITLDSDIGPIYFKDFAKDYVQKDMKLEVNPKTQLIVFKNARELIDSSVSIVDWDKVSASSSVSGEC